MKKYASYISIAAALLFAGCSVREAHPAHNVISIVPETYTASKAAFSGIADDGRERINWEEGDMLRVLCQQVYLPGCKYADYVTGSADAEGIAPAHVVEGDGLIWNDVGVEHRFYGIYPVSASVDFNFDAPAAKSKVFEVQNAEKTENAPGKSPKFSFESRLSESMLMLAKVSATAVAKDNSPVFLDFQPVTTSMKFSLTNGTDEDVVLSGISLTSEKHYLSGSYSSNFEKGVQGFAITRIGDDASPKAMLSFGEGGIELAQGETVHFSIYLLPEDNISDLKLNVLFTNGNIKACTFKKNGQNVTFQKQRRSYLNGLVLPAGVVWEIGYSPVVAPWENREQSVGSDGYDYDFGTDANLSAWEEGVSEAFALSDSSVGAGFYFWTEVDGGKTTTDADEVNVDGTTGAGTDSWDEDDENKSTTDQENSDPDESTDAGTEGWDDGLGCKVSLN